MLKRVFDLAVVFMSGFFLALPFLILAFFVWITSPGPIIYWSDRVGCNNQIFKMPKFRSVQIDTLR